MTPRTKIAAGMLACAALVATPAFGSEGDGFTLGAGGHWQRHLSDDTQKGATVPDSVPQGLASGPSIKCDNGKGWFITAKWQRETSVRNRPAGSALWVKTSIPL